MELFQQDKKQQLRTSRRFLIRVVLLALSGIMLVGVLAARVCYLTLDQGERLYDLSEKNYIGDEALMAPRGLIFDRKGRVLAKNEPRFDLYVSPFELEEGQIAETLRQVVLFCPAAKIPPIDEIMDLRPRWKRIKIASKLSLPEAMSLLERRAILPGLQIDESFSRFYPYGRATAQLTGYVGYIPASRMAAYSEQGYSINDTVGLSGIERDQEGVLRGDKGVEMVYRDAWGRVRYSEVREEAKTGQDVYLTLDIKLQTKAFELLGDQRGVVVAVDPRNGDVLAMASTPTYDANHPERASLDGNSEINKAVATHYAPGSTFKMVTATAALQAGITSPDREILCDKEFHLTSDQVVRCMGYHGYIALSEAIEKSCNLYFYTLASELSFGSFYGTASSYGFGQNTGFPLERPKDTGVLGLPGTVTRPPYYGNRIMMGIGQGRLISVTPLQLAMSYATFANDGKRYAAGLIQHVGNNSISRPLVLDEVKLNDSGRRAVMNGLIDVVNSRYGTGRHAEFPKEWKVAGKTGTAQRAGENDAWFVCFAPYDDPQVCVVVLLERGGHGGEAAAPLAREFIAAWRHENGFKGSVK